MISNKIIKNFPKSFLLEDMRGTKLIRTDEKELFDVVKYLKDELKISLLLDITAIDHLHSSNPPSSRFELIYLFRSKEFTLTFALSVLVKDPKQGIKSIVSLYQSANWLEREVYD